MAKRTAIVYHFFAHYRSAVLRDLVSSGIRDFLLVAARRDPLGSIKPWDIPPGIPFRETSIFRLGGQVLWQSGLMSLALGPDVDSIIYLANPYWPSTWLSAILARLSGKRVFFWTHGWKRHDRGLVRLVRNAYHHIAHGLLLYGHCAKMVGLKEGFAPERMHVIYNSMDYEHQRAQRGRITGVQTEALRRELFSDPELPIVICVCRLIAERRLDLLVDAASLLAARGHRVNLLLVGDGPDRDNLMTRAAAAGLSAAFPGACYSEERLAVMFMAACVTVAPSQSGLTTMHSLGYGTPFITNDDWEDQGPEFEAIVPGRNGEFYPRGDVEELANAIQRWTRTIAPSPEVRSACIDIVERFWNPDMQVRAICRALDGRLADDLFWQREPASRAAALPPRTLVAISNGVTPYGLHFLKRVARELQGFKLRTVYSYEYSMGRWPLELPPEINASVLGKGESCDPKEGFSPIREWRRWRELVATLKKEHPHAVMIIGYTPLSHYLVIRWCRLRRVPVMMIADSNIRGDTRVGVFAWLKKVIVSGVVGCCDALLPCGSRGSEYFRKYGAEPDRIFCVPNEPDYSLIENCSEAALAAAAERFGVVRSRRRLIFSGRLVQLKRVDLLIGAFAEIAEKRADWDLLIVGMGPLRHELGELVPEHLKSRVVWPGFLGDQAAVAKMYRLSDVLVLPSTYEAWGLVVNEAACAGLALVCSDVVGAAADLLRDGENGRLCRAGDAQSLVEALLDVTDPRNTAVYQRRSREILAEWRIKADPVGGVRSALVRVLGPSASESGGSPVRSIQCSEG